MSKPGFLNVAEVTDLAGGAKLKGNRELISRGVISDDDFSLTYWGVALPDNSEGYDHLELTMDGFAYNNTVDRDCTFRVTTDSFATLDTTSGNYRWGYEGVSGNGTGQGSSSAGDQWINVAPVNIDYIAADIAPYWKQTLYIRDWAEADYTKFSYVFHTRENPVNPCYPMFGSGGGVHRVASAIDGIAFGYHFAAGVWRTGRYALWGCK